MNEKLKNPTCIENFNGTGFDVFILTDKNGKLKINIKQTELLFDDYINFAVEELMYDVFQILDFHEFSFNNKIKLFNFLSFVKQVHGINISTEFNAKYIESDIDLIYDVDKEDLINDFMKDNENYNPEYHKLFVNKSFISVLRNVQKNNGKLLSIPTIYIDDFFIKRFNESSLYVQNYLLLLISENSEKRYNVNMNLDKLNDLFSIVRLSDEVDANKKEIDMTVRHEEIGEGFLQCFNDENIRLVFVDNSEMKNKLLFNITINDKLSLHLKTDYENITSVVLTPYHINIKNYFNTGIDKQIINNEAELIDAMSYHVGSDEKLNIKTIEDLVVKIEQENNIDIKSYIDACQEYLSTSHFRNKFNLFLIASEFLTVNVKSNDLVDELLYTAD